MFGHGQGGAREIVHPGNQEYVRGDRIERPQGGGGGGSGKGQASDSGEGEDDFVFHLTKEEFMQVFFDDLALPHLIRTQLRRDARVEEPARRLLERRHADQPARGALDARRDRPAHRDRRGARARAARARGAARRAARSAPRSHAAASARSPTLEARDRGAARARSSAFPILDPIDLRFRNRVRVPVPTTKAVMFCLMDVSGSMDEARKDLAKRFFILLYLFLTRHYDKIDIVFIRHHTQAQEVDEENFFHATRDRRHRGLERAGADGRDHPRALLAERMEHLRRAGQRRRQLAPRLAAAAASC